MSPRQTAHKSSPTTSAAGKSTKSKPPASKGDAIRTTDTHIFFWGSILSNWHLGPKFSGSRCFEMLQPELAKLAVTVPHQDTFTARLLSQHSFNCGEQWMMAMKAWFFERDLQLGETAVGEEGLSVAEFDKLKEEMYLAKLPREWGAESSKAAMWNSTVCNILRTKAPRQQKALGRQVQGFDGEVWDRVNMACVTAACVARAEADPVLRELYLSSGQRVFVEGSPLDTVWGVGLHWEAPEIDDPALWRGENRLGQCHNHAAAVIKELSDNGVSGSETKNGR